jgi:hypothetical protein
MESGGQLLQLYDLNAERVTSIFEAYGVERAHIIGRTRVVARGLY